MKRRRLFFSLGIIVIVMVLTVVLPSSAQGLVYTVKQDGVTRIVEPVKGPQDVVSFYDYYSVSGHTPFMAESVAVLYLYEGPDSAHLSLVIHHHIDNGGHPGETLRADFDFTGMPASVEVAISDDTADYWASERWELDLEKQPPGHWRHSQNSDGGALSGFPTDEPWCIAITPFNWQGIKEWRYLDGDATQFVLDMSKPVTICAKDEAIPTLTEWGLIIFGVVLLGFITWVFLKRRKVVSVRV